MSAKSLVVEAPRTNRPKIVPMNHGSAPRIVFTVDQPATFSSSPRGIAIVTFAHTPCRFVRSGGAEYAHTRTLVKSTIQRHSRWLSRPGGLARNASTHASTKHST